MRLLVLGVSALALGACSVGGGYSWDGGGIAAHPTAPAYDQGYQGSYHASHQYGGYDHAYGGHAFGSPCGAPVPAPAPSPCDAYAPPVYAPPVYTPHSPQPCQVDPCAASAYPVAYAGQTPEPYTYGSQSGYGYGAGYGYDYDYDYAPHAAGSSNLFYGGRLYGSLGAAMFKIEAADLDTEAFGVQARLGYDILPYLSAEIEGAIGVVDGSGEETLPTTPPTLVEGDIGVDYSVGVFGVGRFPVSPELGVFGRVGYHEKKLSIDTSLNGGPVTNNSDSLNGLAYGGGLEYNVTQSDAVRADFTRYETDIGDIDSVSVAYLRRF